MNPIIVNFTPTGMIPRLTDTPYVPITPEEIIRDVQEAWELGISMVHLHARDRVDQTPRHQKELYHEIIAGIRQFAPELIICVSTSGRSVNEWGARSDVLSLEGDVKPDMASLTLSSLNFNQSASINEPAMIQSLAKRMYEQGIQPELELFDLGMVNYCHYLIKKGYLSPPYYANIILGNVACAQADMLHIGCMINDLPEETLFALGAVGQAQLKINALAIAMGWGVRVGIEDNYWYDDARTQLAANITFLQRIHRIISANEHAVMTSQELRHKLNLAPGYGRYGTARSHVVNGSHDATIQGVDL